MPAIVREATLHVYDDAGGSEERLVVFWHHDTTPNSGTPPGPLFCSCPYEGLGAEGSDTCLRDLLILLRRSAADSDRAHHLARPHGNV